MSRARRALGAVLAGAGIAVFAAWATSRVLTDRFEWSQYAWWVPSPAYVGAMIALAAAAWCARARMSPMVVGATLAGLLALAHLLAIDWRLASPGPRAQASLRVVFWNPSLPRGGGVADRVLAVEPDLAIISNPPLRDEGLSIDDLERALGDGSIVLATGNAVVASRLPILRWGVTTLGLRGRVPRVGYAGEGPDHWIDPGHASFIEVDARPSLGTPLVVWIIDLPSDLSLARRDVTRSAREAIDDFAGPTWTRVDEGRWARSDEGFPSPDVIVGDFNIPRASGSLRSLTRDLDDAFDRAGAGPMATYPRARPVLHIDHAFVAGRLTVARYDAIDPGIGLHRMLTLDLGER